MTKRTSKKRTSKKRTSKRAPWRWEFFRVEKHLDQAFALLDRVAQDGSSKEARRAKAARSLVLKAYRTAKPTRRTSRRSR